MSKYIFSLILIITNILNHCFADAPEIINSNALLPNIKNCLLDREALSLDDAYYKKTDIDGALPYIRNYSTGLSGSVAVRSHMIYQDRSIGGWTDNYQSVMYVKKVKYNTQGVILVITLRLPGDYEDRYYYVKTKESNTYPWVERVMNPNPAYTLDDNIYMNYSDKEQRGYELKVNNSVIGDITKLDFSLNNNGIIYKFKYIKDTPMQMQGSIYKVENIVIPNGEIRGFGYDSNGNLGAVSDRRGNRLTFYRNSNGLIDEVRLSRNNSDAYINTKYEYESFPWGSQTIYTIKSSNSMQYGKESYSYERKPSSAFFLWPGDYKKYYFPLITGVYDENSYKTHYFIYENQYHLGNPELPLSRLKETYQQIGDKKINHSSITRTSAGQDGYSGSYRIDYQNSGTIQPTNISYTLDRNTRQMVYSFSGTPCYNYNNRPITKVTINYLEGSIDSIVDGNGKVTKFTYDGSSRLLTKTLAANTPDSQITSYHYTTLSNGFPNTFSTPNQIITDGQTLTNTIDPNGWVTQQVISYPKGGNSKIYKYTYFTDPGVSNYGLISNVDGPRDDINDSVTITYDVFGNKATTTQNVNNKPVVTKYLNYNLFAKPERIVHPSGLVDQFIYNVDGTLKSRIIGAGGDTGSVTGVLTSYTYDNLKRKKSETNPDNETTVYDYDVIGRLIKITAPDGSITTQTYFDNSVIQTIEGAVSIHNELNADGRISKTRTGTDANHYWKAFTYDGNGNITQTQTALGIIEKWAYDALNRNISYTDGEGNVSTKAYDKADNVISSKDAVNSGSSPFNYISSTLVKDEVNNDYATKSFIYNQADQITNTTHSNRNCTHSNIDSLGRTGGITCSVANTSDPALAYNYQYAYDQSRFGRLDKVTSNAAFGVDTQYTYDNLDRIVAKTQTNKSLTAWGGVNTPLTVTYSYSAGGKVTSIKMPSGRVINYNYDGNKGRLASVHIAGNPFISKIAYDALGQLTSWNIENTAAKYSLTYEALKSGSISGVAFSNKNNANIYSEQYAFDQDKRITSITKLNNNLNAYTYDKSSRLISEKSNTYAYDKNGNRKSNNSNAYNYILNTNKVQDIKNGNTVLKTANYLPTGELRFAPFLSVYDGSGQMRYSGGTNGQYYMSYNHKNERTIRALNAGVTYSASAVQFVYDENSNLIGEYTANGTPIVEYVWIGNRPVAAIYGTGAGKTYAIITGHNATPRMLVDNSSNAVVWQWESTAFGGGKPTGSVTFNLRFPGQYYDEFTGLHYNLHRYYNPELGRYMEPDPIGLEGGLNPYAYAYNNPITYVDLTGEHPVIIAMGVGAGMSSAFYVGKVGINAFIEAKKNNQDLVGGTWDNLRNSFSWTEMGQQAALGAAFGGIGKAAFLAADVHVAKTALSENATLMQKAANWGGNLATNKTREFTTNAGFVITSNLLVSKTSANLAISSYNEQRAIARMNQQLAYQEFYRKFYQQYNNQVPIIDLGTLPVIRIQANGTEAQARQQIQIGINQYFH